MKSISTTYIGDEVYISDDFITLIPTEKKGLRAICCTDLLSLGLAFIMLQAEFERRMALAPSSERTSISMELARREEAI